MQFLPSLRPGPSSAVPRLLIFLVTVGALAAPPARADVPVVPLEPAEILPVPADDRGHTPPEVMLTPDGGYLAVWVDLEADRVIGRRFGPPDEAGASESEGFALSSEGATTFGPVVVARGAGDSHLAVWRGLGLPSADLVARAFDGEGQSLAEARTVVTDTFEPPFFESFGLAARPGGGYVLAWGEEGVDGWEIWYRFLGTLGQPLASSLVADLPSGTEGSQPQLAVGPDGTFAVTWRSWQGSDDPGRLQAQVFSGSGQPAGQPFELLPGNWTRVWHDLAATGAGEFLLAWAGGGGPGTPARSVLVRSFHSDGTLGSPVRLDFGDEPDRAVVQPTIVAVPGGGAVAAWAEGSGLEDRPRARLLDPDGEPTGDPFDLFPGPLEEPNTYVNGIDVDRDAEGRLVFGWGIAVESQFIPTDEHLNWSSRARRFQEAGTGCHPILTLGFRTEPAAPGADHPVRFLFEGLADCAEVSLTDWRLEDGTFHVEAEAELQICGTVPPFPFALPVEAGALGAGNYGVELEIALPQGGTCQGSFAFTVDTAEPPPPPPPPPDAPPLTTDAVPGFRFWVAITAQGDAILGSKVEPCIPETLCVSGRLPGRHEVFARIVGPKPNGRLWPTLVKFSTSQVEVWVEQVATGEVEYYLLEGASPGFDQLPGHFDREGFEP